MIKNLVVIFKGVLIILDTWEQEWYSIPCFERWPGDQGTSLNPNHPTKLIEPIYRFYKILDFRGVLESQNNIKISNRMKIVETVDINIKH